MDVLWGIIIMVVMYIVIPGALIFGAMSMLGGANHMLPPFLRRKNQPPRA